MPDLTGTVADTDLQFRATYFDAQKYHKRFPEIHHERLHSIFATVWRNAISAFPESAAMLNFLLADSAADKRYDLAEPTFSVPHGCT
jgi:hypothetical protein